MKQVGGKGTITVIIIITIILNNMRILQLNTRAISTSKRYIENYAATSKLDILCLSETWNTDDTPKIKNFTHFWKNRKRNNKGGVAILVSKNIKAVHRRDLEVDNLEAIWVETCIANQRILVASVYIPPGNREDLVLLESVIDSISQSTPIILTGDFNARCDQWDKGNKIGIAWTLGRHLERIAVTNGFKILNDGTPTRIFGGHSSAPDVTLSRGVRCPCKWHVDHQIVVNSDHSPIILQYEETRQPTKTRWDMEKTDWQDWKTCIDNEMENWLTTITCDTTAEDACRSFTESLLNCANSNIKRKRVCSHSKPFMTEAVKVLLGKCKVARNRYRKRRDPKNWKLAQEAVKIFMEAYDIAKQEWMDKISEEITLSGGNMWQKINKIIKGNNTSVVQPLRLNNGEYTFDDEEISNRMRDVHILRTHVSQDIFDKDWFDKINTDTEHIIMEELNANNTEDIYNTDINIDEVNTAIGMMKKQSAPGPDTVLPRMISEAGNMTREALLSLFQTCWNNHTVPDMWKEENRIYIPKPGKTDYHVEKASRPLSLTSVVGKLMERIICRRLVWHLEANGLMDPLQFAYRRNHNITQAILTFVLDILEGFKRNEHSVATFVDLEGAFDSVWREGVIHKLWTAGIRGRMLLYVANYLKGRKARNLINSFQSTWITTNLGVPQGSVISPILFIIFIREMTLSIPKRVSYADDLFAWTRNFDISKAELDMQKNVMQIMEWNKKWRLAINVTKTEVICFTKDTGIVINITVEGRALKQVEEKVCLGVTLDQHLTFITHTDNTARRAMGALTKISALMADIGGLKMEIGVSLYKACIRPLLEFAYPVWCCAPEDKIRKLERVQRIALLRASGAYNSTPASALEVMTNVPPLRIRYEEILAQEFIRIHRKPHTNHLRSMVLQYLDDRRFMDHRILTPLHQMNMAVKDLCREFDPRRVDHEPVYLTERMHSSIVIRATTTWQKLGSSKSRTAIQASEARKITHQQISETDNNWVIAFTDGSALGNPGPCGASAIIYANGIDSQPISIRKAISKKSSSYHGELYAIYLAVDFTVNYATTHQISGIRIFSDCQSAILTVSNSTQDNNFTSLTSDILERVHQLYEKEINIDICWVAGHAGLIANELADTEAKLAAHEAADMEDADHQAPLSLSEAKGEIRKAVIKKWQHRWDISETGRTMYQNKPSVTVQSVRSFTDRTTECKVNRIRTGHTKLKEHLHKLGVCDSPVCMCDLAIETVEHKLLQCTLLNSSRDTLINTIELGYVTTDTPHFDRTIDISTLTGENSHMCLDMRNIISRSFAKFLADSVPVI